jgi:short-subunit dehydrogenase
MIAGRYTLITGASEGLGKSFALECAARGHNLILVALPGPELSHLAAFIEANFGVIVFAIGQDLSEESGPLKVFQQVYAKQLKVNVLINNAGIGNTRFFEEEQIGFYDKQIRINVLATTTLTHLFVPLLKQNGPAYILNVGSLACFFAIPRKQVYGGTKSFIYFFSRSLRAELKDYNINVSVLCPGGINSNARQTMLNKSGSWISLQSLMNPEDVAPLALNAMYRGKEVIIPGKLNRLFVAMDPLVPQAIKNRIIKSQIGKLRVYQVAAKTLEPRTIRKAV